MQSSFPFTSASFTSFMLALVSATRVNHNSNNRTINGNNGHYKQFTVYDALYRVRHRVHGSMQKQFTTTSPRLVTEGPVYGH